MLLHRYGSPLVRARHCRVVLHRETMPRSYDPGPDECLLTRYGITVQRRWTSRVRARVLPTCVRKCPCLHPRRHLAHHLWEEAAHFAQRSLYLRSAQGQLEMKMDCMRPTPCRLKIRTLSLSVLTCRALV